MKGIVLAGGTGSRMMPLTKVTNKHLLPVHNKPMIDYTINTLTKMGIDDIMVITGVEHAGDVFSYLGSGKDRNLNFTYRIQDQAGGIAQALALCENFASGNDIAVILGDNVFEDKFDISDFVGGARIYLKPVSDPKRFGVATIYNDKVTEIQEKPKEPKSNLAVTGLYLYDNKVFEYIKNLKPSARGEYEISDVNNYYVNSGKMTAEYVKGFWSDAGTIESLMKTAKWAESKYNGN